MEVIFLWILICEWTIWAIYLLDLLAHTLDFSLEYSYQKTIRTNIRIYSYQNNDTNEYPNMFVSKKWYEWISEYIFIKKMIRIWYERIFVSENIRIYSNIRIFVTPWPGLIWWNWITSDCGCHYDDKLLWWSFLMMVNIQRHLLGESCSCPVDGVAANFLPWDCWHKILKSDINITKCHK